ncbi:MAG: class IV adenylate cyclase, partial [Acidimicrobiia bacterium]
DELLRHRRCVLRLRQEAGKSFLTFKGPAQLAPMKVREEWETLTADGEAMLAILNQLGFTVWFRYQKFREEFALAGATLAIDETPMGTFVEIEGAEQAIIDAAQALGRTSNEYLLDSYRTLYLRHCQERGNVPANMLFERPIGP